MYQGCKTVVRNASGESNSFGVEVGLRQCSALSPYLFLLLMDVLTQDVRKDVPGSMMFADDIVLCGDDETDMIEYLDTWRKALEERGMRISRPKIISWTLTLDRITAKKESRFLDSTCIRTNQSSEDIRYSAVLTGRIRRQRRNTRTIGQQRS